MLSKIRHQLNKLKEQKQIRLRYEQLKAYLPAKGTFVEAGAFDGKRQSNTYGLETRAGWTGLLVEPIPKQAALCRINRPNAIVENCALVAFDFAGSEIEMFDAGLMSIVSGSHADEDEHLRKAEAGQNLNAQQVKVPVARLSDLLDKHGLGTPTLLCLDMEGYEPEAIRGIDWARHRPQFLLIEGDNMAAQIANGALYEQVTQIGDDWMYRLR